MTSCSSLTSKQRPPAEAPLICSPEAYLVLKDFEIEEMKSGQDKEFKLWAARMATLYPQLKKGYSLLYGCVSERHPEIKGHN